MTHRIAIIGAGAVAGLHGTSIARHPDTELVAVCDLDATKAAAVSASAQPFTDYEQMLASVDLDAVIVNTPHATHVPITLAALRHGAAALVEKPLAIDPAGCREVIDAATLAGLPVVAGHLQRFMPEVVAARQAIADGRIGKVLRVDERRSVDYRPGTRPAWFHDATISGGGAMINVGGHCVDRTLALVGSRVASVRASLLRRWGSPVETDAHYDLDLVDGRQATVTLSSLPPQDRNEAEVTGELGTIAVLQSRGAVLRTPDSTEELYVPTPQDGQNAFDAQWANFVDVLAGKESAVSLDHALHVVEVITGGYRSAAAGGAPVIL